MRKSTIQEFGKQIHETAVEKGWWDGNRNINVVYMLIVTELSEAVEADREGRRADIESFEDLINMKKTERFEHETTNWFKKAFILYIKDTVEDELADAFIRCLDYLYYRDGEIDINFVDVHWKDAFAENIFFLTKVATSEDIRTLCGGIYSFCSRRGIDLEWHVKMKMRYNGMRPKMHGGKKY